MKAQSLPEEKLLRLIKGEKPLQSQATQPLLGHVDRQMRKQFLFSRHMSIPRLAGVNLAVPIGLLVSVLFLSYGLFQGFLSPVFLKRSLPVQEFSQTKEVFQAVRPVEEYIAMTSGKHIFAQVSESGAAVLSAQAAVDEIQDISVIGIISGETPQAIIEDKKNQKTYYLVQGQSFGDITVDRIESGKVIVNSHGKQYELYL